MRRNEDEKCIGEAIDEEFAPHLAQLEAELRAEGFADEALMQEVRRRFGDPAKLRKQCQTIAMKEHVMLQKVNVVMTVVLIGAVIVLGYLLISSNHNHARMAESLTAQLVELKAAMQDDNDASQIPNAVKAYGMFVKPGLYPVTPDLKLSQCIESAIPANSFVSFELRRIENGFPVRLAPRTLAEIQSNSEFDVVVRPGDVIFAMNSQSAREAAASLQFKPPAVIYLGGEIDRPGVYNLPQGDVLTVSRLLAAAGGVERVDLCVSIERYNTERSENELIFDATVAQLHADPKRDVQLVANDHVRVFEAQ